MLSRLRATSSRSQKPGGNVLYSFLFASMRRARRARRPRTIFLSLTAVVHSNSILQ